MEKGKLYLIPNTISDSTQQDVIPWQVRNALLNINYFLAEDIRTARRFLSSLKIYNSIEPLQFELLSKDTKTEELKKLFQPIFSGSHLGILSESGCPGVADPGAIAVRYAHDNEIRVVPLVGPSSILLAIMASGMNGQRFAFQGYLPIDEKEAIKTIKELERESGQKNQTQIFIETPYRNNRLLGILLKNLSDNTLLSISIDITGSAENIRTLKVKNWRSLKPELPKAPTVFLLLTS